MRKKRRIKIKHLALIICGAFILLSFPAFGELPSVASENQGLYFENISISELQKIFKENNSNYYIPRDNWQVPAIFLKTFPQDFYQIKDENLHNELFIQILSPLALKLNNEILSERATLEKIETNYQKNKKINQQESIWLEEKAKKYDVFTRLKNNSRTDFLIYKLKEKIDIIPPSILIAIAGIETDWGKSRFVKEGNALYKEILWNDKSGILPLDEDKKADYSIKKFPSLYEAMKSFALKLNSNVNYANMRTLRADLRRRQKIIDGRSLASSFVLYSPQKNFIGVLDYTITFYELINIDSSKLVYQLPLSKPAKQEIVIKN